MSKCLSAAVAAILALATGACQQPTAQQMNTTNANSPIYIGALTCTVSGGSRLSLRLDQGPELRLPDQGRRLAAL